MTTNKIVADKQYHVGSNSDALIASTPATLYYESQFSFLPPSSNPSSGAVIRCDVYNTASVRGLLTHLDMNFEMQNVGAHDIHLTSITKLFEWCKIYVDNVEIMWMSDTGVAFNNYCRNLVLDSLDWNDYKDKWQLQGGLDTDPRQTCIYGYYASQQTTLRTGGATCRVQIPLDMITSFLFHRWDTRLCQKISVEIKFRNTVPLSEEGNFITEFVAGPNSVYPDVRIANSWITQRAQLYTSPAMFQPLNQVYMKTLLKTEKQTFTLPAALNAASVATYTPQTPMSISFRLADTFSIHKRILSLTLALRMTNPNSPGHIGVGQNWIPNACGARVYKGGKLVEDLSNYAKFSRQSDHYWRCMGSNWVPESVSAPPRGGTVLAVGPSGEAHSILQAYNAVYNSNAGNILSFLDRGLAETNHAETGANTKVNLIGGISNAVEENWSVELSFYYNDALRTITGNSFQEFTDQLDIYLNYYEIAGIQANPSGGPSSIKVFS